MKKVSRNIICPLITKETECLRRGEFRKARMYSEKILVYINYSYEWYAD